MLGTEIVSRELPHLIPPYRRRKSAPDRVLKGIKPHQRQYRRRKAAGLCTQTGCGTKPEHGHTHCRKHLQKMSRDNKAQYQQRKRAGLCIYCGLRPQFWGVRCVICRQAFAKDSLPVGARRALRLYREAEQKREREQLEVETRHAARMVLASGDIDGDAAEALRLYVGADDGKWRTYEQVGQRMKVSKEWIRKLLMPSKIILGHILGDRLP